MESHFKKRRWPIAEGGESTVGLVTLMLAALVALQGRRPTVLKRFLAALGIAISVLIIYFFRDPERETMHEPGLVVSAADGEVVEIVREREDTYLNRETVRVSVFLSILDVHVQRIPMSGKVLAVEHRPGKFLQAFRPEASRANEHIAMLIETAYGPVLVKQIAGILARRCVNRMQVGDDVCSGQRFGIIKFGSRVDLFVPPGAELLVAVGHRVTGGVTPVARLAE